MKSRQELMEEREKLKKEMIDVDKAIARHPDTIKEAFKHNPSWDMEEFDELLSKITFFKHCFVPKGIVIEFEGKAYRLIKEKDEHFSFGPLMHEQPLDWKIVEGMWAQEEPIGWLRVDKEVIEDIMVVGYLLTASTESPCAD